MLQTIRHLLIRSGCFRLERELPGGVCTHDICAPWQGTQWNRIEAHIEFIATFILFTKSPFWLRLSINKTIGATSKLNLLKECLKHAELFNDKSKHCIADCFAQVEQCRTYRNAIIHHHIYDHEKGIGSYLDDSHSPYQILVSIDALTILYEVLCSLLDELREIDLLFRIETDAQRPGTLDRT